MGSVLLPGRCADGSDAGCADFAQVSDGKAYSACVEHNKELQGITGGESGSVTTRRQFTTAVCPECHTTHPAGSECW